MSGYLDFSDADMIALTRQRRLEREHRSPSKTLYFGGSKSIIAFRENAPPTPLERSVRRHGEKLESQRRRAAEEARAHKYRRIYDLQNGCCYLCGEEFSNQSEATDDHVTPKSRGGRRLGNILHACRPCNEEKSHRAPFPCELLYLLAINLRLPRHDLKRASGKYLELPAFTPLRQRA